MAILPIVQQRLAPRRWLESLVAAVIVLTLAWVSSVRPPSLSFATRPNAASRQTLRVHRPVPTPGLPRRYRPLTTKQQAAPVPPAPPILRYRVRWGDTLWAIADRFHTSVAELEAVNHLSGSLIVVNTVLTIPLSPHTPYHSPPRPALIAPPRPLVVATPRVSRPTMSRASEYPHRWTLFSITPSDELMMAHLVQAEAGDQPFVGQVAVAAVVLNRLRSPGFPKTVLGVIFAPGQFETVTNGTFWNPPSRLALLAVKAAVHGWDPTNGALYFYNPSVPHAAWMDQLPETRAIGSQVFCR
ncbi:MAG: cell wall hydrolase [Firmicutes bacterium]|nr:cell wall hydrolase [Bacillota bacterium]